MHPLLPLLLALTLTLSFNPTLAASPARKASTGTVACNGHVEYCSRLYSNVSIVGAHDSYAVNNGYNLAANQNYNVTVQLENGIRLLQVQGHMNNGEIHLCHTSCALYDAGTFTSYLTLVHNWLVANPNEVVTLLLVNTDGILPPVWFQSYVASGLSNYSYIPPSVPVPYSNWPTLGELISTGKRVVSFLAQNADAETAPALIDEFTNVWETPYDQINNSFPCNVDRVTGDSSNKMYLVNHFLDVNYNLAGATFPIPDISALPQTNNMTGVGSLTAQSDLCIAQYGLAPTFTLVDFYDIGNGSVFEYAAQLNGVTYIPGIIGVATPTSNSTSTSSSSTAKGTATATGSVSASSSTPLKSAGNRGSFSALSGIGINWSWLVVLAAPAMVYYG